MRKRLPYINPRFAEKVLKRRSRRRMAWVSLVSMISIVFMMMFFVGKDRLTELTSIIDTTLFCLSSIVGAYLGTALLDDKNIMTAHSEQAKAAAKTSAKKNEDDEEEESEDDEEEAIEKGPVKKA